MTLLGQDKEEVFNTKVSKLQLCPHVIKVQSLQVAYGRENKRLWQQAGPGQRKDLSSMPQRGLRLHRILPAAKCPRTQFPKEASSCSDAG